MTSGAVGPAAQRPGWFKIASEANVKKFVKPILQFRTCIVNPQAANGVALGWV